MLTLECFRQCMRTVLQAVQDYLDEVMIGQGFQRSGVLSLQEVFEQSLEKLIPRSTSATIQTRQNYQKQQPLKQQLGPKEIRNEKEQYYDFLLKQKFNQPDNQTFNTKPYSISKISEEQDESARTNVTINRKQQSSKSPSPLGTPHKEQKQQQLSSSVTPRKQGNIENQKPSYERVNYQQQQSKQISNFNQNNEKATNRGNFLNYNYLMGANSKLNKGS